MTNSEIISYLENIINKGTDKYGQEFLIGYIELDNEIYNNLMKITKSFINNKIYVDMHYINMVIFFTLVNFAIKDYQNDKFWKEAGFKFGCDSNHIESIGKKAIESFCLENNIYFHQGRINRGFVTTVLAHAIIPNSSLSNFIDFLQDIYFKDLEEDYIDQEVNELLQYMHRLFSKYLDDEDISLIVKGTKMTIARQQLPKSFRIAYVKSPRIVKQIIERLLYYIDQRNYGQNVEYLENDRFETFFSKYTCTSSNFNKNNNIVTKKRPSRRRYFTVAQFYYENGDIILQLPRQIIESDYVAETLYLEIMFGDRIYAVKELVLIKSRLIFKTEEISVKLSMFSKRISYRIKSGNNIVFDSKSTLYRDFILFGLDGYEINPKNLSDETIRIISSLDDEILSDDAELIVNEEFKYKVTTVFMNEESLLIVNDKALSTNVAKIRTGITKDFKYSGLQIEKNNRYFQVYSDIPDIKLRIAYGKNIDNYIISINNNNYHINDVSNISVKDVYDGSGDELAIIKLFTEIVSSASPSTIIIREKGSNIVLLEENIFIVNSLSYSFNKDYYYKEKEASLNNLYVPNMEIGNNLTFPIKINIGDDRNCKIPVLINEKSFVLIIKVPVLSWDFNKISSRMKYSEDIWYKDLSDYRLKVEFPDDTKSLYLIATKNVEKIEGKRVNDSVRFSLDYYIQTATQATLTLGVKINDKEELITNIHFKPIVKDFEVKYYDKSQLFSCLYASWNFCGTGDLFIDIVYLPYENKIKSYHLEKDETIMDRDLELYYGEYEVIIYQMEKDDFFGGKPEKKVLLKDRFIVGDPVIVKCKNKTLQVRTCISGLKEYEIENFYLKDIDFGTQKDTYRATGFYYIKDRYNGDEKEWYFTKNNPFYLKKVFITSTEIRFEIVDKEGDGLIYDSKTTHINPKHISKDFNRFKLVDYIKVNIS